jgi:hypothetical protein
MQIFSNRVHMNINFRYASIIDKKISFLAQVKKENIQIFFGIVTFGPPCILRSHAWLRKTSKGAVYIVQNH